MTASASSVILGLGGVSAVGIHNPDSASPFLFICDHASNYIPDTLGTLGVAREVLESHAAWDPGAYDVAFHLARSLDAALIFSRFSRLVYDVNRPPDSAEAIRIASEIYEIPGNQNLSADERKARAEAIYAPFHKGIGELLDARAARGHETVIVTIHSFTPIYHGRERQVEIGILHDQDSRLADKILECAVRFTTLKTERNQPYSPVDGVTHTLAKHAVPRGILNAMIEIRNDLIRNAAQQLQVAETLAAMLQCALDA